MHPSQIFADMEAIRTILPGVPSFCACRANEQLQMKWTKTFVSRNLQNSDDDRRTASLIEIIPFLSRLHDRAQCSAHMSVTSALCLDNIIEYFLNSFFI